MAGARAGKSGYVWVGALVLLAATAACSAAGVRSSDQRRAVAMRAKPFPLASVRLLDSPFRDAMERNGSYLLSLEPDRLLHNFRKFAGLEPKAPSYGGWEARGIAGHTLGHYLSACSLMYASTGDKRYKERVAYIVSELALAQRQRKDGYVGGIPDADRLWSEIGRGEIRASGFDLNGAWVPWYTVHKLYAGLIDAHRLCGDRQAKAVVTRLGDWAARLTRGFTQEQWQKMLVAEHGGMNEVMADLYAMTGRREFLELARAFNHGAVLDPLARREDRLDGQHANTQIPKVIGAARQYELTGETRHRDAAAFFWDRVTQHRSYAIGGNSDYEHFFPVDQFPAHLSPQTAETCNTYNMLKLTRHLFSWEPSASKVDYYERALYNHILASQDPQKGMMTYFVSLKPGHFKVYNTPEDSFWCCTGSGMENHGKYGEAIYFHDVDSLYVNLFIPSELTWREKGLVVRQETRFPEQDTTLLTVTCREPVRTTLKVRYPGWARGVTVTVNGEEQPVEATPGSYVSLTRRWRSGDRVEIRLPMSLRLEPLPHAAGTDGGTYAVLYGPIVLAGELGAEGMPSPYVPDQRQLDTVPTPTVPLLVSSPQEVLRRIAPVEGKPLTFRTQGIGKPADVTLIPFYRMHHQRYVVYWKVLTDEEWRRTAAELAAAEAARKALEARIVDEVRPAEQQSEIDHRFQGQSSRSGDFNNRKWRDAAEGGWFSYELKVRPDALQELRCTYWGGEGGRRTFDILVDGKKLATQTLANNKPGEFFTVVYPIPAELTRGKQKVTVRFQGHERSLAGGVFGLQILTRSDAS